MPPIPTTSVEVSFYGLTHGLGVRPRVTVDVPWCSSVRDVLKQLGCAQDDGVRQRLVTRTGALQPGIQVFVDGERLRSLDDPLPESQTTRVKILVLTASAGG